MEYGGGREVSGAGGQLGRRRRGGLGDCSQAGKGGWRVVWRSKAAEGIATLGKAEPAQLVGACGPLGCTDTTSMGKGAESTRGALQLRREASGGRSGAEVRGGAGLGRVCGRADQVAQHERRRSRWPSVGAVGDTVKLNESQEQGAEGVGAGTPELSPEGSGRRCGVGASGVSRTLSPLQGSMEVEAGSRGRATIAGIDPNGLSSGRRGEAERSWGEPTNPGARGSDNGAPGRHGTVPRRWTGRPVGQDPRTAAAWGSMNEGACTRRAGGWRGVDLAAWLQEEECATHAQLERREPPRSGIGEGRRSTKSAAAEMACRSPDGLSKDPAPAEPCGGGDGGRLKAGWKPRGGGGAGVDGSPRRPIGERVGGGPVLRNRGRRPSRGRGGGKGGGGQAKWYEGCFPPRRKEEEGGKAESGTVGEEEGGVAAWAKQSDGAAAAWRRWWGPPRAASKGGIRKSRRNSQRRPVTSAAATPSWEAKAGCLYDACGRGGRASPRGEARGLERGGPSLRGRGGRPSRRRGGGGG